jgi:hypothetical protein
VTQQRLSQFIDGDDSDPRAVTVISTECGDIHITVERSTEDGHVRILVVPQGNDHVGTESFDHLFDRVDVIDEFGNTYEVTLP